MSQSLTIGRSFLPAGNQGVESIIDAAIRAATGNPEVATEITLAATNAVLSQCPPEHLRSTIKSLMDQMCLARDQSLNVMYQ